MQNVVQPALSADHYTYYHSIHLFVTVYLCTPNRTILFMYLDHCGFVRREVLLYLARVYFYDEWLVCILLLYEVCAYICPGCFSVCMRGNFIDSLADKNTPNRRLVSTNRIKAIAPSCSLCLSINRSVCCYLPVLLSGHSFACGVSPQDLFHTHTKKNVDTKQSYLHLNVHCFHETIL